MRRPVISAPKLAIDWLMSVGRERGTEFNVDLRYAEGRWVGAGEPLMYISGSLVHLSDLETILLQKLGPACVSAFNAFNTARSMVDRAAAPAPRRSARDRLVPASILARNSWASWRSRRWRLVARWRMTTCARSKE